MDKSSPTLFHGVYGDHVHDCEKQAFFDCSGGIYIKASIEEESLRKPRHFLPRPMHSIQPSEAEERSSLDLAALSSSVVVGDCLSGSGNLYELWSLPPRLNKGTNAGCSEDSSTLYKDSQRLFYQNLHHNSLSSSLKENKTGIGGLGKYGWISNLFNSSIICSSRSSIYSSGWFQKSWKLCQMRIFQATFFIILISFLILLVSKNNSNSSKVPPNGSDPDLNFHSWVATPKSPPPASHNSLLNLDNFHFILNNASKCSISSPNVRHPEEQRIFFIVLVHSAPGNFKERQAIRNTWGSVQRLEETLLIRLVFLLGIGKDPESTQEESDLYGDIVTGNFIDSYRNLSYKHIMGYKWALEFCPNATFILKSDDDAFIDMVQLVDFIKQTFGDEPDRTLICNVLPQGTKPVRPDGEINQFSIMRTKWVVTREEYPYDTYPKYCSGLAYLATLDVLRDFVTVSEATVRQLWIDDVFVTGIIRELAGVEPFYMNLRYSYEPKDYRRWLEKRERGFNDRRINYHRQQRHFNHSETKKYLLEEEEDKKIVGSWSRKLPFIFVHLDRGDSLPGEMNKLWMAVTRSSNRSTNSR